MSQIADLTAEHCGEGVPFLPLRLLGRRNSGTSITASRMRALHTPEAPVRIFAAGNTVADVPRGALPPSTVIEAPSIIVKSRGNVGFTYYEKPFSHKNELWSYTVRSPSVDQKFVYYYLTTQVDALQAKARGSSVKLPQLGVADTDDLKLPIPPLVLQREIVRILDCFVTLQSELEAELEARRRQYAHYRDRLLIPRSAGGEQTVTIGEIGTLTRGRRFTRSDLTESGLPAMHYGDIYTTLDTAAESVDSFVVPAQAHQLRFAQPGDVVIAAVSETVEDVGKAVAWLGDEPVAVHDDCFSLHHDMNPKFVAYSMQTSAFHAEKSKYVARAKVKRMSGADLERLHIRHLSRAEQDRIVDALDAFRLLVSDLSIGLPAELAARRKQYEYYRDRLLTFEELPA